MMYSKWINIGHSEHVMHPTHSYQSLHRVNYKHEFNYIAIQIEIPLPSHMLKEQWSSYV